MADDSCGGSTPFKRLVEHQGRATGIYQDRFVGNGAGQPQNGFRSAPRSGQGQDAFGAFVDGSSAPAGMMPHDAAGRLAAHAAALEASHHPQMAPNYQHSMQGPAMQPGMAPPPNVSNWAADFSRFSNSRGNVPSSVQQNGAQQYQIPAHQQHSFHAAFSPQPAQMFAPLYGPTNGGMTDPVAAALQRPAAEADFDREMNKWMREHGGPSSVQQTGASENMEDVDAVMEQMALELEQQESHRVAQEAAAKKAASQQPAADSTRFTDLDTPEIGNLSLDAHQVAPATEATKMEEEQTADAKKGKSAVSEAAERLLETVQHEQGEKWQNSTFLSLMREFRDGKKDIVENEIRKTGDGDDAPAAGPAQ
jgi:hypothetical protein